MSVSQIRWGLVFLSCPLPLDEEQRAELARLAARAYFQDLAEIAVELEGCRGTVRPSSDTVLLGSFYGQRFVADLHLPTQQGQVQFLIAEAQLRAAAAEMAEA